MNYTLSEIYIYPIKSLGGIKLQKAIVEEKGLKYDRRFMLVDSNKIFMTQRKFPEMALLKTKIDNDILTVVDSRNNNSVKINLREIEKDSRLYEDLEVEIWDDKIRAKKISNELDEFFSDSLGISCSLVYMPESSIRIVDPQKKYVIEEYSVSFADAFPFLIIGEESLSNLNTRLKQKLPMNRFRPNFVFSGGKPFDEDRWKSFKIGNITFYAVKPCARCVITTIDQNTATKSDEPLRTLSSFRKFDNKILFGQNLVHQGTGEIMANSELQVIEWK